MAFCADFKKKSGSGVGEFDRSPGTPTPRQTVTRVTANSLEVMCVEHIYRDICMFTFVYR